MKRFLVLWKLCLTLSVSISPLFLSASHLLGGEVTYTWWKSNYFILKFVVYRDCTTGRPPLDNQITYKVFNGTNKSTYGTYLADAYSISNVQPQAPHCVTPSTYCIERGIYIDTIQLGTDTVGYHIVWFRGNRNAAILNLQNAGNVGEVWYAFVPPVKYQNSSPQFLTDALPYQCVKKRTILNQNVYDPDKDSLAFSSVTPWISPNGATPNPTPPPFTNATYNAGYNSKYPFGTTGDSIKVDKVTGELSDSPTATGQYVIAISLKEYRYDPVYKRSVYLGEIRREYQFYVGTCSSSSNSAPSFSYDSLGDTRYVSPDSTLCFDVAGDDPDNGDSLYLWATAGILSSSPNAKPPYATFSGDVSYKGKYSGHTLTYAKSTFCWKPSCSQITYTSPYIVTFNLADDHCNVTQKVYKIYVKTRPILSPPTLLCTDVSGISEVKLTFTGITPAKGSFQQYKIYRKADTETVFKVIDSLSSSTASTYTDKAIKSTNTHSYTYYITSQNTCGLEGLPSDTFTTIVLKTSKIGDKRLNLTWNALNLKKGIHYKVLFRETGQSAFTAVDSTTSLKYSLASCNKSGIYQIQVLNSGQCSSNSYPSSTTILQDVTPPGFGNNIVNTTVVNTTRIDIVFSKSDSNDTKKYTIYRRNNGNYDATVSINHVKGQSQYTYSDNTVFAGSNHYSYEVSATDTCGNESKHSGSHWPILLKGQDGYLSAILSWTKYLGYSYDTVEVQKIMGGKWKPLSYRPLIDSAFTDTGLLCKQKYYYRIVYRESGGSHYTVSDSVLVTPFDTVKPSKPTLAYISVNQTNGTDLVWRKSNSADVKDYIIWRKLSGASKFLAIDTVQSDTTFTDTSRAASTGSVCYAVQAMDSCSHNLSGLGSSHCTVYLKTSLTGCLQKINLQWTYYSGWPVSKYEIYRMTDSNGTEKLLTTTNSLSDTFTDYNVNNHHFYTYRIKAYQQNGTYSSFSNGVTSAPFKPTPPEIIYATKATTSKTGTVIIRWKSQAKHRYIKYSRLFYKGPGSTSFSLLKDNIPVTQDSFVHSGLNTHDSDFSYFLVSIDSCGNVADTSSIHKTMELQIAVGQLAHDLLWTPYEGWPVKKYVIQFSRGNKWEDVDSVDGATTQLFRFPAPCNSSIYYRIKAVNYAGNFAYSDTAGAKAIDTVPPNSPVFYNASVLNKDSTRILFTGADSLDIYGYAVMRSSNNGVYQTAAFVPFTTPRDKYDIIDTVNTLDDYHCYVVITLDSCLNAANSDTFCTIQLKGKALNQAATINWHPFKGYGIGTYILENRKNNKWQQLKTFTGTDTGFLDIPLPCGIDQYYRVIGYENSGSRITFSDTLQLIPFDTISPPAPVFHFATAVPGNGIKLEWSWDRKSDVKFFEIWRKDTGVAVFKKIKTIIYDSTYTDPVTSLNEQYSYYIIAIDSCDQSHRSIPSDTNRVMQTKISTNACSPLIRLSWSAYLGFPKKADTYSVQRSADGINFSTIKTLQKLRTSYVDSSVSVGTRYWYRIVAADAETGYSSISDTVSLSPFVFTLPTPIEILFATVTKTGTSDGEIQIDWNKVPASVDLYDSGYRLYYATKPNGPFRIAMDSDNLNKTSFLHQNIDTRDSNYYYYIAPYNICQRETTPSIIHKTMNLTIKNGNLNAKLSWTRYRGFNVGYYSVEKSIGNSSLIEAFRVSASDSILTDTNIYCGKKYSYRITAIELNGTGERSQSDTVSIIANDNTPPLRVDIKSASVMQTDGSTGEIGIDFFGASDKNRLGYIVYRSDNGGPFVASDTFNFSGLGLLSYVDADINTKAETHSYFLQSLDSCGNIAEPSDTHTVVLLTAQANSGYNSLTWSPYIGFRQPVYLVERRIAGQGWIVMDTTKSFSFIDNSIHCHVLYEYRIRTMDQFNGTQSLSNIDTARGFESDIPELPDLHSASVIKTGEVNGQVLIKWKPSVSTDIARYLLYRRSLNGVWVLVASLPGDTFYIDRNLNTYRTIYEYKVNAIDSCGNTSIDSKDVHRIVNLSATPGDQFISLKWTNYLGFPVQQFEIYRNGTLVFITNSITFSYTDTDVICKNQYRYKIRVRGVDSSYFSWSNQDSVMPLDFTPPKAVHAISATVSFPNSSVLISWTQGLGNDVEGYRVFRKNSSGEMVPIYTTDNRADTTFSDNIDIHNQELCYYVEPYDLCKNSGKLSNPACVIVLKGEAKSLTNTLDWNGYNYWQNGVDYYDIYRRTDSSDLIKIATVPGNQTEFSDNELPDFTKDFCYQVEGREKNSSYKAFSRSTMVCLQQPPRIWIPNAFTPTYSINLNDNFGPKGDYFNQFEMQIFNRWGERVFSTIKSEFWPGLSSTGKSLPDGVYLYKMIVHGYDGKVYQFNGIVTLLN